MKVLMAACVITLILGQGIEVILDMADRLKSNAMYYGELK